MDAGVAAAREDYLFVMSSFVSVIGNNCLWKNGWRLVLVGWGTVKGKNRLAEPAYNAR